MCLLFFLFQNKLWRGRSSPRPSGWTRASARPGTTQWACGGAGTTCAGRVWYQHTRRWNIVGNCIGMPSMTFEPGLCPVARSLPRGAARLLTTLSRIGGRSCVLRQGHVDLRGRAEYPVVVSRILALSRAGSVGRRRVAELAVQGARAQRQAEIARQSLRPHGQRAGRPMPSLNAGRAPAPVTQSAGRCCTQRGWGRGSCWC